MAFFQWRKFNFFDLTKEVAGGAVSSALGPDSVITVAASGRGSLVLGDLGGGLHRVLSRHWDTQAWQGWQGKVEALVVAGRLAATPCLLGLGLEGGVRCLKVWSLDPPSDRLSAPEPVRVSRLERPGSPAAPTLLAVGENLQLLAVGYDDGAVVLHRGDVTKERGAKVKVVLEPGPALAALAFKVTETGVFLYVATATEINLINVTVKDKEVRTVLDSQGCSSRDLCVSPANLAETHFVTGQPDAVYCYNSEGRGQCYAFEGKKRLLSWHRGYLTVVSDEGPDKATVTVFDVQNKFIAFSAPVKPVMAVLAEWGAILLVTQEGKVHQLVEKDTQVKLNMLFKKNFYDVAIKIAKNQQVDSEGLVDIFRQYGDHLYAKGDTAGAIEQYVKTIGTLEPSYVIQRFLDAQKIHQLTAYLQALHRKGLASEDHTTLLLNCYTKLKDSAKLDEFIMTKDREVDFDVDIAISVCRQAGYCKHALALAGKHGRHDLALAVMVEEEPSDHAAALAYISALPLEQALPHAGKYGAGLIRHCPADTTAFLKRLCVEGSQAGLEVRPQDFIPLFLHDQQGMVDFLSHLVSSLPPGSLPGAVHAALLEYTLYCWSQTDPGPAQRDRQQEAMDLVQGDAVDREQALLLCRQTGFTPGLLHLYQQAGLYDQILQHHLDRGDWEAVLVACRRFGPSRPQLWVTALQQVAGCGAEVPPAQFREVLDQVERHRLLSPLQVVTTLSSCPSATLGVVRDYLLRTIDSEEKSIQEDQRVIAQYQEQSKEVREKIERLTSRVTVFQSTQCSACSQMLELPTVHFLCGHGYHQHCFQSYSESDQECPACHEENKKILAMVRSQEAGRHQHDQFHAQLEKAEDGFSIVAEYFGRGLFSTPLPAPAPATAPRQPAAAPQTEGRLRTEARGGAGGGMVGPSEARLRAEERGGPVAGGQVPTEGRLRAEGRGGGGGGAGPGEGRLRLAEQGRGAGPLAAGPSEGRLRAGQMAVPVPRGKVQGSSLAAHLSPSSAPRLSPAPPAHPVPRREDIQPANPFGSPASPANPFGSPGSAGSLGEGNPFASSSPRPGGVAPGPADNPFGEDGDEYDVSGKNPFAE